MDVDGDIDGQLMQQFLSMGTQDKEVLVAELQKLVGNQLNPTACAFFLDMNNWWVGSRLTIIFTKSDYWTFFSRWCTEDLTSVTHIWVNRAWDSLTLVCFEFVLV